MNIDEMVRRARPDSDGWARSDTGRRVLGEVVAVAPAGDPSGRTMGGRRPAARPVLRWSFLGTGLVGAAAAAVLAVSVISAPQGEQTGAPPGAADSGAGTVTARDILLAAATQAEHAPAVTGKYWHVKTLDVYGPERVGGGDGYEVLRRSVNESWDAGDPREASWTGYRELGVRLRTEADERAWRAAGSPTEWTINVDGKVILSTKPRAGILTKDKDVELPRYLANLWQLSLEDVRAMPDEPDALRAWVTSRLRETRRLRAMETGLDPTLDGKTLDRMLFTTLGLLLVETPVSPKVRAAAFRVLAGIDGVRALGTIQDESGRPGQGVELSEGGTTERLIVDGSTHKLLGTKTVSTSYGGVVNDAESSKVVLAAEWSDAAPQVPTLP